jgi:hypothetical protein
MGVPFKVQSVNQPVVIIKVSFFFLFFLFPLGQYLGSKHDDSFQAFVSLRLRELSKLPFPDAEDAYVGLACDNASRRNASFTGATGADEWPNRLLYKSFRS